ncbi:MAG: hypothetical protein K0U54_13505 [Bacteroidetes bacterium]|nr:hypothetical protein [Bacteroidota bacterium]
MVNSKWRINPKEALNYALAFDSIVVLENNDLNLARSNNLLGMAYYSSQEYEKAITYYLESAYISEKLKTVDKLPQIYSNLAACYNIRNDFENTEKYFLKGLTIAENENNQTWEANIHNNLSIIYMENKRYEAANASIAIALNYFLDTNDSVMAGITYMNSGNAKIYSKNYDEAIVAYTQSQLYVKLNQFPLVYAISNTGIGIAYTEQNKYGDAFSFLKSGLDIAKSIKHYEQMMESYKALADYYAETENFKEAYNLSLESQKLKDSVITQEQDANMAIALTKFETEKKEAELKLLSIENEKNKQQQKLYSLLALSGLFLTSFIGFFYYKNNNKNKLLAKQKSFLEATVDEKNILLKETHHRVKNSFQIVSSLLYLQSENMVDKEAQLAIKEAQNRVRSMVLIHQKLYNKDQLIGINTQEYFEDLTRDIFESHQFEKQPIRYSLDIAPVVLDIESITPIGLILNELIINVLKHAFKTVDEASKIHIHFSEKGEELLLFVKDNGIGMPPDMREGSFGIILMNTLAKKLKATLEFEASLPQGTLASLQIRRYNLL